MNKFRRKLSILLVLVLALMPLTGCNSGHNEDDSQIGNENLENSQNRDEFNSVVFSLSDGIDENGYWTGINALDHVELFDYVQLSIPADTHAVSDEAVENEIRNLLLNYSEQQVLDRAVEFGDTVNIDYTGSVDGVEFEGGTTGGMGTDVTIGVTSYIDDFLEQLIGYMPGETINVEVTFPENYGVENLNGRDALFITTINHIVETAVPELSDNFVETNFLERYGWSTVEEMTHGISADLQKSAIQSYIQEYMMDNTTFLSLPDELLTYMEQSMILSFQNMADYYGVEIGEILVASAGVSSIDELIERYHDDNVEQANYFLAIQAVAEEAGITAEEADVAAYFAENMGVDDYSQFEVQYGMPYLRQTALNQMVLDYLESLAALEQAANSGS